MQLDLIILSDQIFEGSAGILQTKLLRHSTDVPLRAINVSRNHLIGAVLIGPGHIAFLHHLRQRTHGIGLYTVARRLQTETYQFAQLQLWFLLRLDGIVPIVNTAAGLNKAIGAVRVVADHPSQTPDLRNAGVVEGLLLSIGEGNHHSIIFPIVALQNTQMPVVVLSDDHHPLIAQGIQHGKLRALVVTDLTALIDIVIFALRIGFQQIQLVRLRQLLGTSLIHRVADEIAVILRIQRLAPAFRHIIGQTEVIVIFRTGLRGLPANIAIARFSGDPTEVTQEAVALLKSIGDILRCFQEFFQYVSLLVHADTLVAMPLKLLHDLHGGDDTAVVVRIGFGIWHMPEPDHIQILVGIDVIIVPSLGKRIGSYIVSLHAIYSALRLRALISQDRITIAQSIGVLHQNTVVLLPLIKAGQIHILTDESPIGHAYRKIRPQAFPEGIFPVLPQIAMAVAVIAARLHLGTIHIRPGVQLRLIADLADLVKRDPSVITFGHDQTLGRSRYHHRVDLLAVLQDHRRCLARLGTHGNVRDPVRIKEDRAFRGLQRVSFQRGIEIRAILHPVQKRSAFQNIPFVSMTAAGHPHIPDSDPATILIKIQMTDKLHDFFTKSKIRAHFPGKFLRIHQKSTGARCNVHKFAKLRNSRPALLERKGVHVQFIDIEDIPDLGRVHPCAVDQDPAGILIQFAGQRSAVFQFHQHGPA